MNLTKLDASTLPPLTAHKALSEISIERRINKY